MIKDITFEAGSFVVTPESGGPKRIPIKDMLRSADIPTGLTYEQVGAITTLPNLVVVLIRTLINSGVIDESFMEKGEYNLKDLIETIEGMGGDFGNPDLTVA
jgi:hypothetical protein